MFYQYSRPECLYQRLHNKLGTFIFKTGILFGIFWLEVRPGRHKAVSPGSKTLLIWSTIATLAKIGSVVFLINNLFTIEENEPGATILSTILGWSADIIYCVSILVTCVIVTFSRTYILKVFILALKLQNWFCSWRTDKNGNYDRALVYNLMVKTVIDCCCILAGSFIFCMNFISNPSWYAFSLLVAYLVVFIPYSFLITLYCVPFAYGLFSMQNLVINLRVQNCHVMLCYHYLLLKFMKKVNFLMQSFIFLVVFAAFVGLVSEVSI